MGKKFNIRTQQKEDIKFVNFLLCYEFSLQELRLIDGLL